MRLRWLMLLLAFAPMIEEGANLRLVITPRVAGEEVQPASLRYRTSADESFSITRISYLLCDFSLQRENGSWLQLTNSVAWFDEAANRRTFSLTNLPTGVFRSIRFSVGLNPKLNHADASKFPPDHPLNPTLDGLNWSWQGGYIFLALEGLWRNASGELDGWAYHFARDSNCTTLTLSAALPLANETQLNLDFDLAALLNAPVPLSFARDGSSTHSREGDPVSAGLAKNILNAFRVRSVQQISTVELAAQRPKPLYLPEKFTPYPFQMDALFPMPDLPRDNPLTVERVKLGRALFNDRQLSINNKQACIDCHAPARGFTDGRPVSLGAEGHAGTRKTMSLFNLAWKKEYFWDGRAHTLREQVLGPIQNAVEMHETLPHLVAKLSADTNYAPLFQAAFGAREVTAEKIALALENYLLTLTSFNSRFDRALRGEAQLNASERRGFELFSTEYDPRRGQYGADCFHCHGGPLFRSQNFGNNGLDVVCTDAGYSVVSGRDRDLGKFAVPSLRNVALSGPYMHDGRFVTLEQVVEHYSTGVKRSATLDPNLAKHPDGGLPLSETDKKALVDFLKTLTEEKPAQAGT